MLNIVHIIYKKAIKRFIRKVKVAYYKYIFGVRDLDIYFPVFLEPINNIAIGEGVAINAFVHIWANAKVEIGNNTLIASHVQITTSTHDYNVYPMKTSRIDMPVKIGNNVWIGSGAIIFPGVSIGDNSVIGAGSLVNKDIPANSVAYGVPAKVSKQLAHKTK
jgi:acetyltransferase-like isoleucine patch superfamily enzyme